MLAPRTHFSPLPDVWATVPSVGRIMGTLATTAATLVPLVRWLRRVAIIHRYGVSPSGPLK
jgi:hypothetical protein